MKQKNIISRLKAIDQFLHYKQLQLANKAIKDFIKILKNENKISHK